MKNGFLPISKEDMREAGIDQLDFVYVCGDAYVDHPSFGHAIISRLLEAHGYKVGIIAQPDWHDKEMIGNDWFERGLFNWGYATGTFAICARRKFRASFVVGMLATSM